MNLHELSVKFAALMAVALFTVAPPSSAETSASTGKIDQAVLDSFAANEKVRVLIQLSRASEVDQVAHVASAARLNSISQVHELEKMRLVAAELDAATLDQIASQTSVRRVMIDPIGRVLMPEAEEFVNAHFLQQPPFSLSGLGRTVAVLDTGLDITHPDISANVSSIRRCICNLKACCAGPFDTTDTKGHGTLMTGTIVGNNGIAPATEIIPIKIFDDDGFGLLSDFFAAVELIDDNPGWGVDVINMSLALGQGPTGGGGYFFSECSGIAPWATRTPTQ